MWRVAYGVGEKTSWGVAYDRLAGISSLGHLLAAQKKLGAWVRSTYVLDRAPSTWHAPNSQSTVALIPESSVASGAESALVIVFRGRNPVILAPLSPSPTPLLTVLPTHFPHHTFNPSAVHLQMDLMSRFL